MFSGLKKNFHLRTHDLTEVFLACFNAVGKNLCSLKVINNGPSNKYKLIAQRNIFTLTKKILQARLQERLYNLH